MCKVTKTLALSRNLWPLLSRVLRFGCATGISFSFFTVLTPNKIFASSYIVANGDDGGDLEGGKLVTTGILLETRAKAIERLRRLNTPAIDHLGTLIPELEKSDILLVERNLKPRLKNDMGLERSADGSEVYARTFAEPHAATRFFPAALSLNEEQLIALHIHEALHRSLPASVRENEAVVTRITLALTASDTSIDRARRVVASEIGSPGFVSTPATEGTSGGELSAKTTAITRDRQTKLSSVTYTYQSFSLQRDSSRYPIDSLHNLRTVFYPLGNESRGLGLGMEFSYLKSPNQAYIMRPLTLLGQLHLTRLNNFDLTGFASIALNTMTNGSESSDATSPTPSPVGRDFTTLGVSLRRDDSHYFIENKLSLSLVDEAKRKVSSGTETYHAGKVINAFVHAGGKYRSFELGGFAELLLSDSYKSTDGQNQSATAGRFRVLGAGPELSYLSGPMRFSLAGKWVVDATPGMSVDDIGDLIGYGVGQASVSASASLRF
jgi:hypothetical protein